MKEVIVYGSFSDDLLEHLRSFVSAFSGVSSSSQVKFNLQNCSWIQPLLLVPLAAHISKTGSEWTEPFDEKVRGYLSSIGFPNGTQRIQERKSYFPLTAIDTNIELVEFENKQKLFLDLICKKVPERYKNAIRFSFSELTTNVLEHSHSGREYLFAQEYQKKGFMDICILDTGRGFARCYKEERSWELSDEEAIEKAVEGYSSKHLEGERGYGLRKSIEIVRDGLDGEFILVTGSAILYVHQNKKTLINAPKFYWQGVIALFRIPTIERVPFNLYDFLR
ncbi:MAG: hypothetical protein QW620_07860 [Thermoplasmata archaeon]